MDFLIETFNINSTTLLLPSNLEFEHHRNSKPRKGNRKVEEYHKIIDTPNLKNVLINQTQLALPFYPDVTIHWRCSDNIFFDRMGLTPYRFIIDRLPDDAKYVFITTETSYYDIDNPEEEIPAKKSRSHDLCIPIIAELVRCIRQRLPNAQVVVRSGGTSETMFLTVAMFVHSNITFCSASTFCFHFATAKPAGKLYLPATSGIFYGTNLSCCGDDHIIETMANAFTITDWRHPGNT